MAATISSMPPAVATSLETPIDLTPNFSARRAASDWQSILLPCDHDEVYSLGGESFRDRQADADAGSCDDSDFAFQSEVHKRSLHFACGMTTFLDIGRPNVANRGDDVIYTASLSDCVIFSRTAREAAHGYHGFRAMRPRNSSPLVRCFSGKSV